MDFEALAVPFFLISKKIRRATGCDPHKKEITKESGRIRSEVKVPLSQSLRVLTGR